MTIGWKTFEIEGKEIKARITNYEAGDKKLLGTLYKSWLALNIALKKISTRGINIPESITENAFCMYHQNCVRVDKLKRGKCSFDAINIVTAKRIQIKASSVQKDLTSFGPRSEWDELYFLDFSRADGSFDVYIVDPDLIYNHKMNSHQTFTDQQNEGKRPRFSIKNDAIIPNKITPLATYHLY